MQKTPKAGTFERLQMTLNELFFVVLVALNSLDIYTTIRILRQGGTELNPVVSWLMDKVGVIPALIIPKTLFLSACWFFLLDLPTMVMFGLCCFYALIVLHNYGEINHEAEK